ncbi:MFS transporter [bacterium]|nr:MAG: MFS transporter [bacterium]
MLRALQYPNYRLFFGGQLISLLGSWMTQIATTWLVYKITGSSLALGTVAFAGQIPAFLLGPVAGAWIDRVNRHKLLVVTQILAMLQSFGLAFLTLSGNATMPSLIALMAFQGLINAFDMPARQSFVVEMIENKEDLSNAIALNSSMFNMARLVGPAVGGVIIAAVGEGWCFLIDAVSYIGVIGCLLAMKVPKYVPKISKKNPFMEAKEGFHYAFGFAPIRSLIVLMGAMSLMGMPYAVLMPVVATKTLHGGPNTLGFLMAATGCGALAGALVLAARSSIRGLTRVIPMCTLSFGALLLIFSHVTVEWLAIPLLFGMGFAMMTQNAASNTLLQTIVDSDMRGRVMSLYTMAFMGLAPFGSLWAGDLAQRIGAPNTLVVSAVGCLAAGLWFMSQLPALRNDIQPIYQRLGIIPSVAQGVEEATELAAPPPRSG